MLTSLAALALVLLNTFMRYTLPLVWEILLERVAVHLLSPRTLPTPRSLAVRTYFVGIPMFRNLFTMSMPIPFLLARTTVLGLILRSSPLAVN